MAGMVTGAGRARESLAAAAGATYRQGMPDEAWGVVDLTLITLGVVAVLWAMAHAAEIFELGVSWGERLGLIRSQPVAPGGMPIERIAADLRRIRPQALQPATGTPMARRRAIAAAYDECLLDACRALEVPTELDRMTDAFERESERLRTESELERAGVDLR
jgi:hypothetical protein